MLFLMVLALLAFDSWVPASNNLQCDGLVIAIQPFVTTDSKIKGQKILIGGIAIENTTETSVDLGEFVLTWQDGSAVSLSQEQIRTSLKQGGWLTEVVAPGTDSMARSAFTAYNINGQILPPKQKANFTASFLVPPKAPSRFVLTMRHGCTVELSK
jgi:hypothetical protein